jgi:hypothetical protein
MGWIGCICCEKFRHDFVARTFALVRPVLHRVSKRQPNGPECSQIVPNAPKRQFRVQGVDRVHSLRKILTRLRGTNFCISSACFALSFVWQPNGPKCTQIVRNATKHQFRVRWGVSGVFVAKNSDTTSWYELLNKFGPFCPEFRKVTKWFRM